MNLSTALERIRELVQFDALVHQARQQTKEAGLKQADIQSAVDEDPSAPVVQQLSARWIVLIQKMNGPDVPLPVLVRCGRATLRDFEKRSPELASSPWGRGMRLMMRAVSHHGPQSV